MLERVQKLNEATKSAPEVRRFLDESVRLQRIGRPTPFSVSYFMRLKRDEEIPLPAFIPQGLKETAGKVASAWDALSEKELAKAGFPKGVDRKSSENVFFSAKAKSNGITSMGELLKEADCRNDRFALSILKNLFDGRLSLLEAQQYIRKYWPAVQAMNADDLRKPQTVTIQKAGVESKLTFDDVCGQYRAAVRIDDYTFPKVMQQIAERLAVGFHPQVVPPNGLKKTF